MTPGHGSRDIFLHLETAASCMSVHTSQKVEQVELRLWSSQLPKLLTNICRQLKGCSDGHEVSALLDARPPVCSYRGGPKKRLRQDMELRLSAGLWRLSLFLFLVIRISEAAACLWPKTTVLKKQLYTNTSYFVVRQYLITRQHLACHNNRHHVRNQKIAITIVRSEYFTWLAVRRDWRSSCTHTPTHIQGYS